MTEYQKLEIVFKKCPVCSRGEVAQSKTSGFWSIFEKQIICDKCGAVFSKKGIKDEEQTYQLKSSEVSKNHKYVSQILKKSEWERGTSDIDYCIETNTLPNAKIMGLNTLLKEGENTHHYSGAELFEERAVRTSQRGFGAARVMKGVYIGGSSGTSRQSHSELKQTDKGSLLLTSRRLIFNGRFKNIEYELKKITSVEEYKDAIEIAVSNRKNVQIFGVDEPHKWAVFIKMAFAKYNK